MECWVCHLKFPTNRELKNHMGPTHGTLKVICPWCPDERTYKRVTDLRSHAKQSHSHQLAKYPGDLITESNGIWFSLHPEGYNRLVPGSEWGSNAATHARVLVLEWLSKTKYASKKKDNWVNDWESLKKKGKSFAPTPEALFQPDYIETETEMTETTPSGYSPARPKIDELEVEYISLAAKKIFLRQGNNIYAIHLRDTVLVDPKAMASIARKMGVQKTEREPTRSAEFPVSSPTIQRQLLKFVGLEQKYLENIRELKEEETAMKPIKRKRESEPEPPRLPSPCTASSADSARIPSDATTAAISIHLPQVPQPKSKPIGASLSERALNLLKRGCLPLFPPARRDWGTDQVTLRCNNITVVWPPMDWQEMSPDRRLLSWEYTALTLQERMDQSRSATIERIDLLDKFNFLALPGTVVKNGKKTDHVVRKSRYYIYEQLKNIVSSNSGDSVWIRMLERSCALRDRSTDNLLAVVEDKDIPIRL